MAFANGGRIVTDGLILSLDASDRNSYASGSATWTDLSGNSNNGTLQSTPSFSSASNGGITFLSTNQYTSTNLTVPSPSTRATTYEIAFIPATGSFSNVLSGLMGWSGYLADGFSLGIGSYGDIYSQGYNSGIVSIFDFIGYVNYSSINVVTAVYQNLRNTYYINGILSSSPTYTTLISASSTTIKIGGYSQGGWAQSQCTVFYARVYNRALSSQEVLQNYNASKSRFNLT
jgi:hypothetical protein